MAFEVINLNLIPTGEPPVIHAAQYDIGRPMIINMYIGEDAWTPEDVDIELQVRKVDANIVTVGPDSVDGNTITFLTTEQMTACSGSNICVLKFSNESDGVIATLYFYLVVQRDILQGGLTSDTAIHNLDTQIEELLPGVLGDNYYTKTEVDELIDEIPTFDPTNYYDKTATDNLLSAKANTSSLSAVATSGNYNDLSNKPTIPAAQVNSDWDAVSGVAQILNKPTLSTVATSGSYNDLTDKPSIPAAQVQSDWAQSDNTQVDFIKNKPTVPVIETVTIQNVAIASFNDGADNVPLSALEVEIEPSLSGVSSVNVVVNGVNQWDEEWELGNIDDSGQPTSSLYRIRTKNYIPCKPSTTYRFKSGLNIARLFYYDETQSFISYVINPSNITFTTPNNCHYLKFRSTDNVTSYDNSISINYPSTDTQYHAYNGTTYPISLGETLTQGGSLNVKTGLLTRTDTTTSQLSGMPDIRTILGNNNIFADSGDIEKVTYFKTGCESIARLIEAYT